MAAKRRPGLLDRIIAENDRITALCATPEGRAQNEREQAEKWAELRTLRAQPSPFAHAEMGLNHV